MSSELWEELLSEKNKHLLKLTNKYAARMKRQQVNDNNILHVGICPLVDTGTHSEDLQN